MNKIFGTILLGIAAIGFASTADAQGYPAHYHKHGRPTAMYVAPHHHGHAYGHYNHGRVYHHPPHHGYHRPVTYR